MIDFFKKMTIYDKKNSIVRYNMKYILILDGVIDVHIFI